MRAGSGTTSRARRRFCYWTVATQEYADLAAGMVASARRCGVTEDFHVWSDRSEIPGAISHRAGSFEDWGWLFKLVFLSQEVSRLKYDYLVYLDSDNRFVRHPGNLLSLVRRSPLHVTLEADLTDPAGPESWWEYPRETFVGLARQAGIRHSSVYTVNGGMFIVQRDAISLVYELADKFWQSCRRSGVWYVDEPLLAYAMQKLCPDPHLHTLERIHRYWASDWNGAFEDRLPVNEPFRFIGLCKLHDLWVNPAVVHAMRSKRALLAEGLTLRLASSEQWVTSAGPT